MTMPEPVATSPLDPFLGHVLIWAAENEDGFAHSSAVAAMVSMHHWQPAFAEAVFTSARVRGMITPYYGRRARGRSLWALSKRGTAWLAATAPDHEPAATGTAPPEPSAQG